jgi:hypothetical protein
MNYPTMDEVENASHIQLARWYRFLPSPGADAIYSIVDKKAFEEVLQKESAVMSKICERFKEFGGMNSTISRLIGWD